MFLAIRCPSHAQQISFYIQVKVPCFPTEIINERLREKYKETLIGAGITGGQEQVRLFTTHNAGDNQTWTLIITSKEGDTTCVIKSGENWVVAPVVIMGDPT